VLKKAKKPFGQPSINKVLLNPCVMTPTVNTVFGAHATHFFYIMGEGTKWSAASYL